MADANLAGLDSPQLEAMIETMFLAAHADGDFSEEERAHFAKSVESLTDRRVAGDALAALVARIEAAVASEGREARLAAVKARLSAGKPREIALSLAIRLMASDGIIRTSERELILEAAEALEIDRDVAADMVREAAKLPSRIRPDSQGMRESAHFLAAALGVSLLAGVARADDRHDAAPNPNSTRSRAGVEGEGATVSLPGVRGSYVTAAAFGELAPVSWLSLRARVPVHRVELDGEGTHTGLGDIDLRLRWRIKRGERLQVSIGVTAGLPTGDASNKLGDGSAKLAPFVTAGLGLGPTVLYVTIADQIGLAHGAGPPSDVTDPGTDHELRYDLGVIHRFGDVLFATAAASGITALVTENRGDTLGYGTVQLGATPDPAVRLTVGGALPVFGTHRFDAKTIASLTILF